ncbi:MAG: hypothetical protein QOF11_2238, partial [Chloroflexota bacterium]|nr:hypothetical protein [Chloroflexota bacterium]
MAGTGRRVLAVVAIAGLLASCSGPAASVPAASVPA